MIVKRPFVKVKKFAFGFPGKQMPGEFEHIIRIAGFAGIIAQPIIKFIRFTEVFIIAVSTNYVGLMVRQNIPEKRGDLMIRSIMG